VVGKGLQILSNLLNISYRFNSGDLFVKIVPFGLNGTIDVPYSEPLKLECIAEAGPGLPDPTVQWLHDEGPSRGDLPDGYKPVQIDGRFITHGEVT